MSTSSRNFKLASEGGSIDLNYYKRDQGMRLDVASQKHLYGREAQLKLLHDIQTSILSYEKMKGRIQNQKRRIALVHGRLGCGKTALCHAALSLEASEHDPDDLTDKMFLIEGKYNQLYSSTTAPYSAIIVAFDMLGKQMQQHPGYEASMKEFLKFEGTILTKLIPSFSIYETPLDESEETGPDAGGGPDHSEVHSDSLMFASERLAIAFQTFLRKFTTQIRPLSLFLDDLQWSDRYSQELLLSLLHDDELNNFLFIGTYREEDPETIEVFLKSIHELASTDILTDIPVHGLDLDSVNQLLAKILSHQPEMTYDLAKVAHHKTLGNPYFVIQVLEQLHAQNFLTYNFGSLKWEWDIESAHAGTGLSENVVDVVTRRIEGMPKRVQRILKLAACLGFFVDVELLKRLDLGLGCLSSQHSPKSDDFIKEMLETRFFEAALQRAEEEAFVERAGSIVKFSHDRIQQCVYDMIEMGGARDILHYQIGKYLKKCHDEDTTESTESRRFLFLAVDQLNRGSSLIDTEEGRLSLIELNNKASKIVKQQAGIEAVASFLHKAIELVRPSFWMYHYELILEVYNSSAEVDFSLGMFYEATVTIETIRTHAVRDVDMVRALVVEFQIYGVRCKYNEAIAHGCRVLHLLGEPVPKKVSLLHVAMEYFRARRASKNKPDEFFTDLTPTESTNVKTVLRILQIGSVYGWNGDINFAGFAMLRGFRVSIREGWSETTPFLYSGYGFMLGLFGEYNEAFRFGRLALKARRGKESYASSINLTYANLTPLQLPLGLSLEPYLSAYRVGLETGDLFYGTICLSCYALIYITCGLPLKPFADDLRKFGSQLKICHQDLPLTWILTTRQLALNLMGKSDNPLDLSRDAVQRQNPDIFSENLLLCDEASRTVPADILYMWYLQLYNAYILEDIAVVDKTLKRILALKKEARRFGGTHMMNYFVPFVDGLVGLWLAKKKPKSKTGPRVAKAAIAELAHVAKTRPVNSIIPLKLLRAEAAARKKSTSVQQARKAYDEAISGFSRSGLNHYSAMSNELAGKFMLEKNDSFWAESYLEQALVKWDEYDAVVKVQLLVKDHPFLESKAIELKRGSGRGGSIQGRRRFDVIMDTFRSSTASLSGRAR